MEEKLEALQSSLMEILGIFTEGKLLLDSCTHVMIVMSEDNQQKHRLLIV